MAKPLIVVVLILAGNLSLQAQNGRPPAPSTLQQQCEQDAEAAAHQAAASGLAGGQVTLLYQTRILQCLGTTDPALAAYDAAMRIELGRLASLFLAHKLDFDTYINEVQDRRAKLRIAEKDHAWVKAFQASGDKDGDFVPDSLDRCNNSPPDSLTDVHGCPAKPTSQLPWIARRQRPNSEQIDKIAASIGFMQTPECENAPRPEATEPVHQGFIRSGGPPRYSVTVTRVMNQPAKCPLFYQVEFRFLNIPEASGAPNQFIHVAFRDNENLDKTVNAERRRVFQVTAASSGIEQQVYNASFRHGTIIWRVRALNGNGLTSGWSPPKTENFDGVYDPLK